MRGAGRQRRRYRVADAGQVVVRDPLAQIDDRRREERLIVHDAADVLELTGCRDFGGVSHHASGQDAGPERHLDTRPYDGRRHVIWHSVGESVQEGDGNGDGDQARHGLRRI
jgi:hypothetical protein